MSESSTPIDPLIRTPRKIVDRTIETQETINRQGLDLTRQAVKPIAGAVSGDRDAGDQVDDAFDRVDEQQAELLDGVQSVADRTFESSENAAEWGYDLLDRQVGRLQRAEDTAEDVVDEAADTTEDVVDQAADSAEELADETADTAEDVAGEFRDEIDAAADEFDSFDALDDGAVEDLVDDGVETMSDLASAQADAVADVIGSTTEEAEDLIDAAVEHEGESLGDLDGIGETYSDRLAAGGIRTVDQLARTSAGEVADVAQVGEERAAEWIQRAQDEA